MKHVKIPTVAEEQGLIAELLATNRYFPADTTPVDEHGMPIVEPEPDDPDDE